MESFDLTFFDNLHIVKDHFDRISKKLDYSTTPTLTDLNLIQKIYDDMPKFLGIKHSKVESIELNKKFVFVVLQLFAPKVFIGHNLPRGLRNALAKTMKVKSPSIISWYVKCAINLFVLYPVFKADVEKVLNELQFRTYIVPHIKSKILLN